MKCVTLSLVFATVIVTVNCYANVTVLFNMLIQNGNVAGEARSSDDVSSHPNLGLLSQDCGHGQGPSGLEATVSEFPWLGLIAYKSRDGTGVRYRCTATLISERYVLTGRHCLQIEETVTGVRLGNRQEIGVEKEVLHPGYSVRPRLTNDIALLRLSSPADFSNENIHPICLPVTKAQMTRNLSGQNGTIAVWGKGEQAFSPDILLRSYATIQSEANCAVTIKSNSESQKAEDLKVLCAIDPRIETCGGVAATPLILGETDNGSQVKYTLYGLFSFGPTKCASTSRNVYTDVSRYVKWILDNIEL